MKEINVKIDLRSMLAKFSIRAGWRPRWELKAECECGATLEGSALHYPEQGYYRVEVRTGAHRLTGANGEFRRGTGVVECVAGDLDQAGRQIVEMLGGHIVGGVCTRAERGPEDPAEIFTIALPAYRPESEQKPWT